MADELAPPPISDVLSSKDFHAIPLGQRLTILRNNYPDFAKLPAKDQGTIISGEQMRAMGPSSGSAARSFNPDEYWSKYRSDVAHSALPIIGATAATLGTYGLAAVPLAMAGGAAGYLGSEAISPQPESQSLGDLAKNTGIAAATNGFAELGGQLINKAGSFIANKFLPEKLIQSAIGFNKVKGTAPAQLAKQKQLAQTALESGAEMKGTALASEAGIQVLDKQIQTLGLKYESQIAANPTAPINMEKAMKYVDEMKAAGSKFKEQFLSEVDQRAINDARSEGLRKIPGYAPATAGTPAIPASTKIGPFGAPIHTPATPATGGMPEVIPDITAAQADLIKKSTYSMNRLKYGALATPESEAVKAMARGVKDEIIAKFPILQQVGIDESQKIALMEQLVPFIRREGNKRLLGLKAAAIGSGIVGGALAGETHGGHEEGAGGAAAVALAGAAILALDDPKIKSQLAVMIFRASRTYAGRLAAKVAPEVAPNVLKSGVGLFAHPLPANAPPIDTAPK